MQEFNKSAFDMMVFSGVNKVPFGQNVKEFYLKEFRDNSEAWDRFFKGEKWINLDEASRQERIAIIEKELEKFDVSRKTFDL